MLHTGQNITKKKDKESDDIYESHTIIKKTYFKIQLFFFFFCIYDSDQLKHFSLKSVTEIKCVQYVNPSRGPLCLKCKSMSTWVFFWSNLIEIKLKVAYCNCNFHQVTLKFLCHKNGINRPPHRLQLIHIIS